MWRAFLDVVEELWSFLFNTEKEVFYVPQLPAPQPAQQLAVPEARPSVGVSVPTGPQAVLGASYVSVSEVVCYAEPTIGFDSKIAVLHYGDRVQVHKRGGEKVEVFGSFGRGWILARALTEETETIFPELLSDTVYDALHPETVKLRRCLKDEFMGDELSLPLQAVEYVSYMLSVAGRRIPWSETTSRIAGRWQILLRGQRGVHIGVEPRTGAVLEVSGSGSTPFLGYVAAVCPGQSITLHSVGRVVPGEYRVERCTHEEWLEWRPVFISFL